MFNFKFQTAQISVLVLIHFHTALVQADYIAAVVEYQPVTGSQISPSKIVLENTENYVQLIREAKELGSDIIVFPEYGLTSLKLPKTGQGVFPFLQRIPSPKANPCQDPRSMASKAIKELSCAARKNKIYTVVNVGELDGNFAFNTNVVFDREGVIVAKYRKTKLYFEPQFNSPIPPDHVSFETDFGVTFGMFICFDVLFHTPAVALVSRGIRNFITTTAWEDEMPFMTAVQAHTMWAMSAQSNLLSSGYHHPSSGQLGSGIFSGSSVLNHTTDPGSGTRLVVAAVPNVPLTNHHHKQEHDSTHRIYSRNGYWSDRVLLKENLTNYASESLKPNGKPGYIKICHGLKKFCCELNYTLSSTEDQYKLVAFDDRRSVARNTEYYAWQVCGLIRDDSSKSPPAKNPGRLKMTLKGGPFRDFEVTKTSANTLDMQFHPIPFNHFVLERDPKSSWVHLSTKTSIQTPRTVALIYRDYKGDL